jgi:protein-S-isoprenylcysteine O-methyltransferase Ste14
MLASRALAALLLLALLVSSENWCHVAPAVECLLSLAGWILVGLGMSGRIWCGSYISGRKNQSLVVEGPYSISRNPLYFFSFVAGLGVMLVSETLLLPLAFCLVFWAYYPGVISREEGRLRDLHGAVFDAYRARVPRFWPNFRLFAEPADYRVSAARFRRNLADVALFVMAGGLVEFIEGMHSSGYLPTLLRIY